MEIEAYMYGADIYCSGCILEAMGVDRLPASSVEDTLYHIAGERGIDRDDEYSFDSDDFPKVVFGTQLRTGDPADYDPDNEDTFYDVCGACLTTF